MIFCCCCCYHCYNLLRWSLNNNKNKKNNSSGMRVASKRDKLHFSDLQYIYMYICLAYICYSQLRYYDQLQMGPNQIYPTFWINILQDLQWQSSHFQVLMQFLKRAGEAASRISIGTCCQSWLAQYGIASNPYFNERGFSV